MSRLVIFPALAFSLHLATQAPVRAQADAAPKEAKPIRKIVTVYKPFTPTADLCGYVFDNKLKMQAPENSTIASAMRWEHLWRTWHGDKELPTVDFKEHVLFVFTSSGPNIPCLRLHVTGRSVSGTVAHTLKGGPGFGYRIVRVPRKEVTHFFGRAIE